MKSESQKTSSLLTAAKYYSRDLQKKYGDKVSVTLKNGEVFVDLAVDQPMTADIECTADVIHRVDATGRRIEQLKNRDNPLLGRDHFYRLLFWVVS
jgi:hypothetical protein